MSLPYAKIAVISILVSVLQHVIRIIYSLGYHLHFYQHYPGPCHHIEGIELGSGSFHTFNDGTTFITSGVNLNILPHNFQTHHVDKVLTGAIYRMNLKDPTHTVTLLEIKTSNETSFNRTTFRPHGISGWPDYDTGQHILYVVNHPPKELDRVEKFIYDAKCSTLLHVTTFTHGKLRMVYDVLAIGKDSFYASNFLFEQKSQFRMLVELFSLMPWSTVVLYTDMTGYRDVITGLTSATGIAMSQCGTFIYVMMFLSCEIRVYKRQEDNSLILQQLYHLHTHPNAVVLDPMTGDLFIGAHPIVHQFISHLDKPWQQKAASQVLHIRLANGNITSVTELLYDEGDLISGASVAVVFERQLLIGSFVDKLVLCDVNIPI